MAKGKSHKGTLKRVTITGRNKVRHKRSGTSHLAQAMNGKDIRQHRKPKLVSRNVAKQMERVLHRRLKGREQA